MGNGCIRLALQTTDGKDEKHPHKKDTVNKGRLYKGKIKRLHGRFQAFISQHR